MEKNLVLGPILAHLVQIWATSFLLLPTNLKIWSSENLVTDGQMDRRTRVVS